MGFFSECGLDRQASVLAGTLTHDGKHRLGLIPSAVTTLVRRSVLPRRISVVVDGESLRLLAAGGRLIALANDETAEPGMSGSQPARDGGDADAAADGPQDLLTSVRDRLSRMIGAPWRRHDVVAAEVDEGAWGDGLDMAEVAEATLTLCASERLRSFHTAIAPRVAQAWLLLRDGTAALGEPFAEEGGAAGGALAEALCAWRDAVRLTPEEAGLFVFSSTRVDPRLLCVGADASGYVVVTCVPARMGAISLAWQSATAHAAP